MRHPARSSLVSFLRVTGALSGGGDGGWAKAAWVVFSRGEGNPRKEG